MKQGRFGIALQDDDVDSGDSGGQQLYRHPEITIGAEGQKVKLVSEMRRG